MASDGDFMLHIRRRFLATSLLLDTAADEAAASKRSAEQAAAIKILLKDGPPLVPKDVDKLQDFIISTRSL